MQSKSECFLDTPRRSELNDETEGYTSIPLEMEIGKPARDFSQTGRSDSMFNH